MTCVYAPSTRCFFKCLFTGVQNMAGRNNQKIADALESVAKVLQGQQNLAGDEFRGLGKF